LLGSDVLDAALDLEPVPIEIGQTNAITDQGGALRERRSSTGCIVA
jgi:hypothetical protein